MLRCEWARRCAANSPSRRPIWMLRRAVAWGWGSALSASSAADILFQHALLDAAAGKLQLEGSADEEKVTESVVDVVVAGRLSGNKAAGCFSPQTAKTAKSKSGISVL
eukprot:m.821508 g.821508  ORF g.821508 m.821508 type:complete len:108 (+) comp59395_c0_seq70:4711-5034(+)